MNGGKVPHNQLCMGRPPMAEASRGSGGNLRRIAMLVAVATALSKLAGLFRQQAIAAAFGVGAAYDAFNYAYVLPGFLLILLGGINGPFHSAMVSVMAKRERQDSAQLLAAINTLVGLLLVVTVLLVLLANMITLVGPGLDPGACLGGAAAAADGPHGLAGRLDWPGLWSTTQPMCIGCRPSATALQPGGADWFGSAVATGGGRHRHSHVGVGRSRRAGDQHPGGRPAAVAGATSSAGETRPRTAALNFRWRQASVREVLQVMWPATLSSGMLQINVYTDLFFAGGIAGAAAGRICRAAVQTPRHSFQHALVPLLPVFTRLSAPEQRTELIARIRQGVMLSNASMLPLGALMVALAAPIVALVYERGSFDAAAAQLVVGILMAYGGHAGLVGARCAGAGLLRLGRWANPSASP